MATTPKSYDEITARTVPEPDSSFRPTAQQRRDAIDHVAPPPDVALAAKVDEALRATGLDQLAFEVDGARVIVRGAVADMDTWHRVDAALHELTASGDVKIDNRIVVGAG